MNGVTRKATEFLNKKELAVWLLVWLKQMLISQTQFRQAVLLCRSNTTIFVCHCFASSAPRKGLPTKALEVRSWLGPCLLQTVLPLRSAAEEGDVWPKGPGELLTVRENWDLVFPSLAPVQAWTGDKESEDADFAIATLSSCFALSKQNNEIRLPLFVYHCFASSATSRETAPMFPPARTLRCSTEKIFSW